MAPTSSSVSAGTGDHVISLSAARVEKMLWKLSRVAAGGSTRSAPSVEASEKAAMWA